MRLIALLLLAIGTMATGTTVTSAPQQTAAAVRPPLLFREDWRLPKHEGAATDENTRFTPEVVTNERLEAKLYGAGSTPVRAAEHEGRVDLWTGLATSPVALTLRDKRNYLDLTGLARLRWIVRTNAIQTLYPVVKLADGTLAVGSRAISTDGEFVQVEIAFSGIKWYTLDPQKVVVMLEVKNPDLSKVDEVGLASLAPGGGHGIAGSANFSTVELFAKAVPR
ncbi:MAG: hypothetical protein DMG14_04830 [Acidobacteria bacterium]|nr:MAG: hypothetical protein DMG14_04830 [Acidobacteriota bacterium]